jgi:hypothetical protein
MGSPSVPTNLIKFAPLMLSLAQADDEKLCNALIEYHRKKLTNNQEIANLLEREHHIKMRSAYIYTNGRVLIILTSVRPL